MTNERLEQLKAYTATWTNQYDKAAMQEALAAIEGQQATRDACAELVEDAGKLSSPKTQGMLRYLANEIRNGTKVQS